MYVYLRSEPNLWTVGHYAPGGEWVPESDHDNRDDAAKRVAWLNGGRDAVPDKRLDLITERIERMTAPDATRHDASSADTVDDIARILDTPA